MGSIPEKESESGQESREPFEDKRLIEGFKKIQEAAKQGWLKKYTLETLFKFIV